MPNITLSLVRYLESLHVGLIGWGIDSKRGLIVKDHVHFESTDYSSFKDCNDASMIGTGKLLANYPDD